MITDVHGHVISPFVPRESAAQYTLRRLETDIMLWDMTSSLVNQPLDLAKTGDVM
jgi:hypothetical protein